MKRLEANNTASIYVLANYYFLGQVGLHQGEEKTKELFTRAADLGHCKSHWNLSDIYHHKGGRFKEGQVLLQGRCYGRA